MLTPPMELKRYRTTDGHVPYTEWYMNLRSPNAGRVAAYVDRMKHGNFGKSRSVGGGVIELKIDFGPGFRVYYLREGREIVLLLSGGHKGSQEADILKAQQYAADYRSQR